MIVRFPVARALASRRWLAALDDSQPHAITANASQLPVHMRPAFRRAAAITPTPQPLSPPLIDEPSSSPSVPADVLLTVMLLELVLMLPASPTPTAVRARAAATEWMARGKETAPDRSDERASVVASIAAVAADLHCCDSLLRCEAEGSVCSGAALTDAERVGRTWGRQGRGGHKSPPGCKAMWRLQRARGAPVLPLARRTRGRAVCPASGASSGSMEGSGHRRRASASSAVPQSVLHGLHDARSPCAFPCAPRADGRCDGGVRSDHPCDPTAIRGLPRGGDSTQGRRPAQQQ